MNSSQKEQSSSIEIHSKVSIEFQQPITKFFYSQSHIICFNKNSIIAYNTLTQTKQKIKIKAQDFIVEQMPPHLFVIIIDQLIFFQNEHLQEIQSLEKAKISKLQPRTICRFNKGYFMGGYNKSRLPGNKRTNKRSIYYLQNITTQEKNLPVYTISLKESVQPVSIIIVQNPYLLAYCQPIVYLINLHRKEIVLTFEKEIKDLLVLEGRFAISNFNGIGVCLKETIFTFDVERYPLYGVQVTEHKNTCQCLCLQRTGKIFGGKGNILFEYQPFKRVSLNRKVYPEGSFILWISCSPSNHLMVLRTSQKSKEVNIIEVFSLD